MSKIFEKAFTPSCLNAVCGTEDFSNALIKVIDGCAPLCLGTKQQSAFSEAGFDREIVSGLDGFQITREYKPGALVVEDFDALGIYYKDVRKSYLRLLDIARISSITVIIVVPRRLTRAEQEICSTVLNVTRDGSKYWFVASKHGGTKMFMPNFEIDIQENVPL